MSTVADLLAEKGSEIVSIPPSATVLEAIKRMNQHKIGALIVMHDGNVAGMFTERDVLRRVMAEMRSAHQVTVGEVMTHEVICCSPETDVEEVSRIMKEQRIRHLPVCDGNGILRGLISIGDLNAFYASAQQRTIHHLTDYIYGRT